MHDPWDEMFHAIHFPHQDSDDSGEIISIGSEEHGNGSIAGESGSPHSNYGDVENDQEMPEVDTSRSEESEVFVTPESNTADSTRVSPSFSVGSHSSSKHASTSTSPLMFSTVSTELSPQINTKHCSKSNSPKSDNESKVSPKIRREKSPVLLGKNGMDRIHVHTDDEPKSPAKISPKPTKIESPKDAEERQSEIGVESVDRKDNNEACTCWRKPLIDQIFITDVTSNLVTVTVRECYTDKGFFRKRS